MQSQEIRIRIANILITDFNLLDNRIQFLDSLNLSPADIVTIRDLRPYEFFVGALNRWSSTIGLNGTIHKLCEILKSNNFLNAAEKLEAEFKNEFPSTSTQPDPEPTISFEVSAEVWNFTGRSAELKQLEQLFLGNEEYVATITGMGGVGKSELAKRFARLMHKKHNVTTIWFNGQNNEILEASVKRLAQEIGAKLVTEGTAVKNNQNGFASWFSYFLSNLKKRKLVIIDNVDEANEGAASLIKARIPKDDCFLLVTSRNLKVLNFAGEIIELDCFSDAEAQRLVSTSLKSETPGDVKRLCVVLENFPLALQQAVANIKKQKIVSISGEDYKISNYIHSFQEASNKKQLLDHKLNLDHSYELTTLITWEMTMEKIQKDKDVGDLAMKILNSIAYFEPDRISIELLQLFFEERDDVEKAIQLIKTYSLVKIKDKMISIHRLLQQVIQINISEKCPEVQHLRELTNCTLSILQDGEDEVKTISLKLAIDDDSSKDFDSNRSWNPIREGIVHLLSIWNHNCKHPELIAEFKGIPIKIIDVLYPLNRKLERINDVTHFTEKNWSLFKDIFGKNAIESLELGIEVAFASISVLDTNELETIYKSQRYIIGEDNLLELRLLEKRAYYIVSQASAYYKSEFNEYFREYLELSRKIMGPGHESTLPVPFQLIERLMREDPKSVEKWAELLENAKILWGQHNHDTLTIMYQYGIFLFRNKKWVKAKEIFERWLGFKGTEETEEVTWAKWRLSLIQYILGDRESALQTLQQTVVGLENRENRPKKFVEIRSECERGDGKVREGDLHHALRLYTRVTDYQQSPNYPFPSYYNWWRVETCQKRASVLIKLRRCKEALHILQNEVPWDHLFDSDHNVQIERKELLEKVEEGLRLEPADTFPH